MSGPAPAQAATPGDSAQDPYDRLRHLPLGTHVALRHPSGRRLAGWLLPPDSLSSARVVKLKLPSGYNIGVRIEPGTTFEVLPGPPFGAEATDAAPGNGQGAPRPAEDPIAGTVALLTTGGTIASRIDYTTGGVHPVKEPGNLEALYPGITSGGPIHVRSVAEILSEDMTPAVWTRLAEEVVRELHRGVRGVVVAMGTDTLAYTAAALAFQLRDLTGPVVLVGAQRSIDRPSSDGVDNILGAVRVARQADLGEVVVVMHATPSDEQLAIHRGTRVRKMHSTRRDAFRTLNGRPLGMLVGEELRLESGHRPRGTGPARAEAGFSDAGELVWMYPGLSASTAEACATRARGIILAGTGMGHLAADHLPWIRRATERGVVVGMATQCLEGEVDPFVYSRGRELLQAGVAFLGDISPETAFVKLQWALARSTDPSVVRRLLVDDLCGEFGPARGLGTKKSAPDAGKEGIA